MTRFATPKNVWKLGPVQLVRPDGYRRAFGYGVASDTDRGDALGEAVSAAATGDVVQFGPGTYDLGTGVLNLQSGGAKHLVGPGKHAATIESSNTSLVLVQAGSGSYISDFTLDGVSSSQQAPIGANSGVASIVGAVVHRVAIYQSWDCVFFSSANASSMRLYECDLYTEFDGLRVSGAAGHLIEMFNCRLKASGTTAAHVLRPIAVDLGTVIAQGCVIEGEGTDAGTFPVLGVLASGTGVVRLLGCQCSTTNDAGSGQMGDIAQSGSGVLEIDAATTFDPAKASGTITRLPSYGVTPTDASLGSSNKRTILFNLAAAGESFTTGAAKYRIPVPTTCDGGTITAVYLAADSTEGLTVQLVRERSGSPVDVLSTEATIDDAETNSRTAATPPVVNTSNDDLDAATDYLQIDCDASTATLGPVTFEVEVTL